MRRQMCGGISGARRGLKKLGMCATMYEINKQYCAAARAGARAPSCLAFPLIQSARLKLGSSWTMIRRASVSHFPVLTTRTDVRVYPPVFYVQRVPNSSVLVCVLPGYCTDPLAELLGAAVVFVVQRARMAGVSPPPPPCLFSGGSVRGGRYSRRMRVPSSDRLSS